MFTSKSPIRSRTFSAGSWNIPATIELEIRHTDQQEFKSMLKQHRETVRALLTKMPQPMGMAA